MCQLPTTSYPGIIITNRLHINCYSDTINSCKRYKRAVVLRIQEGIDEAGTKSREDTTVSDVSQGSDWWIASDGKWYPPYLHPDYYQSTNQIGWSKHIVPKGIQLQPGERILIVKRPYVGSPGVFLSLCITYGCYEIWRSRHYFILTNQRVIHAFGIFSRSIRYIPLSRVQNVTLYRHFWVSELQLSSAGELGGIVKLGPLSNRNARDFQQSLFSLVHPNGDGTGSPVS